MHNHTTSIRSELKFPLKRYPYDPKRCRIGWDIAEIRFYRRVSASILWITPKRGCRSLCNHHCCIREKISHQNGLHQIRGKLLPNLIVVVSLLYVAPSPPTSPISCFFLSFFYPLTCYLWSGLFFLSIFLSPSPCKWRVLCCCRPVQRWWDRWRGCHEM